MEGIPKEKKSYVTGFTLAVIAVGVAVIGLFTASPNAPLDLNGMRPTRYEVYFHNATKKNNEARIIKNTIKVMKQKQDSIAKVNDSIKAETAKKLMKPKTPAQVSKQVRILRKQ